MWMGFTSAHIIQMELCLNIARSVFVESRMLVLYIDMETSYVIGDRLLDIEFAHNANLPGILVLTGYGKGEVHYSMPHKSITPAYVAKDLLHAVQWILKQDK
jgi:D-glycero-D-manno-heptose 1,7-bisphosphate phosphatase